MVDRDIIYKGLKKFGFHEKEILVYLTVLELGKTSVPYVAKKADIPRPTTYLYVGKLIREGLLYETKTRSRRYILPEKPEFVMKLIEREQERIESARGDAPDLMGAIKDLMPNDAENDKLSYFKYYEGNLEVSRFTYEEALQNSEEIYGYGDLNRVFKVLPDLKEKYQEALDGGLKFQYITIDPSQVKKKLEGSNAEFRAYPKKIAEVTADTFFFDDKLIIVTLRSETTAVVISDPMIVDNARHNFKMLWELSQ